MRYFGLLQLAAVSLFRCPLSLGFELSVLVQNMQLIPFVGGSDDAMKDRAEKYGDLLVELGNDIPDVIGFTETFLEAPTDVIVDKLNTTHPHQLRQFPAALPEGKFIDSGLTLLSKFPIEAHDFRMFEEASGPDALSSKGVLVALIQLPASLAVVSVTHQNAGGTDALFTAQLGTARDLMREFVSENIPVSALNYTAVVSMGDYNIRDDSETYEEMMTTLAYDTEDPHVTLNPGEDGLTYPAPNVTRRIDYVFNLKAIYENNKCKFPSSKVIKYAVNTLVSTDMLSDHLGVGATISISENPDGALYKLIDKSDSCNPDYFDEVEDTSASALPLYSILVLLLITVILL